MLRSWFVMFQAKHPEAHISCAGRGFTEQEASLSGGMSRATYGKSAHNYGCAIDTFVILPQKDLYDKDWYEKILKAELPYHLNWYGAAGAPYYERPHIELRNWKELLARKEIALVEPDPRKANIA